MRFVHDDGNGHESLELACVDVQGGLTITVEYRIEINSLRMLARPILKGSPKLHIRSLQIILFAFFFLPMRIIRCFISLLSLDDFITLPLKLLYPDEV